MKLIKLIEAIKNFRIIGNPDIEISGISDNSKLIKKGELFVAVKGIHFDGHNFINEALKKKAAAVLVERKPDIKDLTCVVVKNTRESLGLIASAWYGYPSKNLKIIGVTGTDGKTTTSTLIYSILSSAGKKVGLISTLGAKIGKRIIDTGFHVTNPEPLLLHKLLKKMVDEGCEYVVLETTSHGLDQERVAGIRFEAAVITNITREHLDYHKTFRNYILAKSKIFKMSKTVYLNKDDNAYKYLKMLAPKEHKVFTRKRNFLSENILHHLNKFFPGDYNLENAIAAAEVCKGIGINVSDIEKGISSVREIPGRYQSVKNTKKIKIIIDFAHTPNALTNLLRIVRKDSKGKLIVVFGCAGERDKSKRPKMGYISGKFADISVITEEDPRSEKVSDIIGEINKGALKSGAKLLPLDTNSINKSTVNGHIFLNIPVRGEAIFYALHHFARPGDVVVITGKGHEKSMAFGGKEYPWSDLEAVKEALVGKSKIIEVPRN